MTATQTMSEPATSGVRWEGQTVEKGDTILGKGMGVVWERMEEASGVDGEDLGEGEDEDAHGG